jgi:hypothetical protein
MQQTTERDQMNEVRVQIELENALDREMARLERIPETEIRCVRLQAIADGIPLMMVLPQDVVEELGLDETRKVIVAHADGGREVRPVAGAVTVRVANRTAQVECVVGPPHSDVLLGQIPLRAMDLRLDASGQRLVPHPESPLLPLFDLK